MGKKTGLTTLTLMGIAGSFLLSAIAAAENDESSPKGTGATYSNLPKVQQSQWDQDWKPSSQDPRPVRQQPQSPP